MEFARLLLAVSRQPVEGDAVTVEWVQAQSMRLLSQASPELRPLVEMRVDDLTTAWTKRQSAAD